MSTISSRLEEFLFAEVDSPWSNREMSEAFQNLTPEELTEVVHRFEQLTEPLSDPEIARKCDRLVPYLSESFRAMGAKLGPEALSALERLYYSSAEDTMLRTHWLFLLAVIGTDEAMERWLQLLAASPPRNRQGTVLAFAPVLRNGALSSSFMERMLDISLQHVSLAGLALDVANFQFREGIRQRHIASGRVDALTELLGSLAQQLARIEEGQVSQGMATQELSQIVNDSIALVVSLCDLVALCGFAAAEGKLRQVQRLRHRRLQVEAAAALIRLGFDDARSTLVELAAEPSVRLRVLQYAEELEIEEEVEEPWKTAASRAEAQMANWLEQPEQMGLAPSRVSLVDERRLFWPGFDDPVECFLVRFTYGTEPNRFSNIGIVGPMTFAFGFDVSTMSLDDLYAAFAGWQAVHSDLYEISMDEAHRLLGREIQESLRRLDEEEFVEVNPRFMAHFFGEWLLVASARHHDNRGSVIVDDHRIHWFIDNGKSDDSEFAYHVYRGRRLLATFNERQDDA